MSRKGLIGYPIDIRGTIYANAVVAGRALNRSPDHIRSMVCLGRADKIGTKPGHRRRLANYPREPQLTKHQRQWAFILAHEGFVSHANGRSTMQRNKCLWKLVELGVATFGFGPNHGVQGFMPVWSDPVV